MTSALISSSNADLAVIVPLRSSMTHVASVPSDLGGIAPLASILGAPCAGRFLIGPAKGSAGRFKDELATLAVPATVETAAALLCAVSHRAGRRCIAGLVCTADGMCCYVRGRWQM